MSNRLTHVLNLDLKNTGIKMEKLKVIYIDDEPELCSIFEMIYASESIVVSCFTNHKDALVSMDQSLPDLVFIDFRLDSISGDEVAKMISPQIPVILMTGELNPKVSFPFYKIFTKPVNPESVQAVLEDFLKSK
jgi:DNA-binding NtrC family response regulator